MNRSEINLKQLDWLKSTQYNDDATQLEADLEHALAYIFELLRFCPRELVTESRFVPPYRTRGFVESPLSTYDDEDLHALERKLIPVDKIRATQWRVFSDAVNYYREAFINDAAVAPILVHFEKATGLYYVKDGHHRLYAHSMLRRGLVDVVLSETGMPFHRDVRTVREMQMIDR